MNISKKWLIVITISISTVIIIIGLWYSMKLKKENEIKESFSKTLKMYPIKNLEDLYDKEGYRDEEFDEDDKGVWILQSSLSLQKKNEDLTSEGMLLKVNRNKKEAKGYYFINRYKNNPDNYEDDEEKRRYPIELKNNKLQLTKKINNKELERKIKNFKFFSQFGNFKNLSTYKNGKVEYNPEVPSYSLKYNLSNSNNNVKKIRDHFDIPTNKEPKLILKGSGKLSGESGDVKTIDYEFVRNKKEMVKFSDSISYQPTY
ncbi:tandem-type lipoprotein [Staphylococcus warneri]|uniref:tandem-type lipoprotein n=2 Tax=Staphylococcus TaxID=1279 RepID=UPI000CD0D038|nr:tandem-type lipoprotein [Staphylococcus warneri]MBP3032778.1 tandem-type lipoprotein [Staphylococcus warneri]MCM3069283.1 tandem-type lipoprotein [Staphylococcus warneri]MCR1797168.1 tandem-type lipoprotein [Staphylococcus warneri]PNY97930.1 tandem-type lipoprotein [Staphylococcus warneri]SUM99703.1 Staphylococcus tandem lipoproteins [Staphylococcus warneri]